MPNWQNAPVVEGWRAAPEMSPDELNILQQEQDRAFGQLPELSPPPLQAPQEGFMSRLGEVFTGTARTEFPELPELGSLIFWRRPWVRSCYSIQSLVWPHYIYR